MAMYNTVLGANKFAALLLTMLDMQPELVPRVRDAWWDGEHIVVYTRTGGGNRKYFEERHDGEANNNDIRAVPGFVRDEDDDYDSTYAKWYFKLPEKFEWLRASITPMTETTKQRWERAMEKMSQPLDAKDHESVRAHEAAKILREKLGAAFLGGNFGKVEI